MNINLFLSLALLLLTLFSLSILRLRFRLRAQVENRFRSVCQLFTQSEERYAKVSGLGFTYLLSLSKKSIVALAEAQQILKTVGESLADAERLLSSKRSTDWLAALELLDNRSLPSSTTAAIQGFSGTNAKSWCERLNTCLETVGTEIFQISQSCGVAIRSLRERVPATMRTLVESGIRCAVKHAQMQKGMLPRTMTARFC